MKKLSKDVLKNNGGCSEKQLVDSLEVQAKLYASRLERKKEHSLYSER